VWEAKFVNGKWIGRKNHNRIRAGGKHGVKKNQPGDSAGKIRDVGKGREKNIHQKVWALDRLGTSNEQSADREEHKERKVRAIN